MVELVVTSAAERDYSEALCWYSQQSIEAAERFEEEFEGALNAIAAAPERFPRCDARHRYYLMRRFPFQVIFREYGSGLAIIAVAHAKRRPGYWVGR
jgi:plasmid stabilization system protein ParE